MSTWIKKRGTECIRTLWQPVQGLQMTYSVSSFRIQQCGRFRGPEGQHLCRLAVTDSRVADMPPRPLPAVLHNFVPERGSYMKPIFWKPRFTTSSAASPQRCIFRPLA
jgi:hypothetical protein